MRHGAARHSTCTRAAHPGQGAEDVLPDHARQRGTAHVSLPGGQRQAHSTTPGADALKSALSAYHERGASFGDAGLAQTRSRWHIAISLIVQPPNAFDDSERICRAAIGFVAVA